MNEEEALNALAALSGAPRLRIVKLLVRAGDDGLTAGEISDLIGASPSRTSFHLATLSKAGLVASSRSARQITYKVNFKAIGNLMEHILKDCCLNNPTVLSCCGLLGGCEPSAKRD